MGQLKGELPRTEIINGHVLAADGPDRNPKRCLRFVVGTVGLIGLLVLTNLSAIAAPTPTTAGPVGHQSASSPPGSSDIGPSFCTAEQYNASLSTRTDCSATAAAPGALTALQCPGAFATRYFCTQPFEI